MEKTQSVKEKMNGEVFFSTRVGIFPFIANMIQVFFPFCTLISRQSSFVPRQGKVKRREMKVLLLFYKL